MRRVVMVALDGSPFAEQALPLALTVAQRAGAALELVRVQPVLPLGISDLEARQYLQQLATQIESQLPGRIAINVLLDEYAPLEYAPPASNAVADVLRRRATAPDVLLVTLATHGFGGLRRAWLGSVADSLIRDAPKPVLLVRPTDEAFSIAAAADRGVTHVLITLDGSPAARKAVPLAVEFGTTFGARFTLLRVVSPLAWQVSPHSYDPYPAYRSPLSLDAARDYLDDVAEPIRRAGAEVAIHVVDAVSPAPAILDYARTHAVDVVAIGTEGAGRVRRLLLGSVTDKVIRGSDVPVLVCNVRDLPADEADRQQEPAGVRAGSEEGQPF